MNQTKIWDYFQNEGIENFAGSVPRLNFLVKQAKKYLNKSGVREPKILNIGVGNAWLENQCVRQGWKTYALDPSATAIERIAETGATGKVGYIEAIPYEDNFFDVVFCSEVLEHLSDEQLHLGLTEINRVLVKGGFLIGTVPFNENLIANQVVCPDCGKIFHRWGHLQSFDKLRMKVTLEGMGFEIIRITTYAFPDFYRRSPKDQLKSLSRWLLGKIGAQIAKPNLFFCIVAR